MQNYTNPFNPSTNINFSIPKSLFVTLKVFNIMGKEISRLVNENLNPGVYSFEFNAEDLASGMYFYKFTAGEFSEVKKMTMIK
ncbi:MAG: T9SS type A sorting domain-containing protein [Ignavibacteria bacterium]